MENAIVQNFWKQPFNKAINLNKLQSLLMESYVEVYTGKFKMHNNQNIYFTSNLHEMLENLLMLIQRKQIYFSSINLNSQTPQTISLIYGGVSLTKEFAGEDFNGHKFLQVTV